MPILAVDQMGRIYQTSGDRADGLGFGAYPTCESQSDTTLGSAYLKSQARRTAELLNRKRNQAILDKREQQMGQARAMRARQIQNQNMQKHLMMQNPDVRRAVLKQGLKVPNSLEYKGPTGGNVMSANGLKGLAGMTRDQQVIHNTVLGLGQAQAHPVDPTLVKINQGREAADRLLRIKALPVKQMGRTRVY